METLHLTDPPVARAAMLIRKPVGEVFEAFVNPDVTTRFWFTKSSGRLEAGKTLQWEWEMYGISISVDVKTVEPDKRIVIEWPGRGGTSTVEWIFAEQEPGATFVTITNFDFPGDGDALVTQAIDSTEGFALVLAGAKALLEHGIELNLVADRYPGGIEDS